MARPSQNTDARLIKAARQLLPETGCSKLNLRQVAAKARVNLGMFHYHFKTKEQFLRHVLQQVYEEFFKELQLEAAHYPSPIENLRASLLVFARFARDNRRLIFALMRDAMNGERVAQDFLRANLHRHIEILIGLIRRCQAQGRFKGLAPANVLVTLISSMNMPSIVSELAQRARGFPASLREVLQADVLSDDALESRIAFLLRGAQ